ncbi:hypothetical protein BDV96DRAFT_640802 [Lophiotrema nucula]|uniref:Uncharacterized protein n=1 Tax=Lophiotrema nucula TaxID=690887 RepID=A0A6A5ZPL8_9PLEO|nr:hypothetical protein BDV96DRAFT_640802 [Lophiotrema nucula]
MLETNKVEASEALFTILQQRQEVLYSDNTKLHAELAELKTLHEGLERESKEARESEDLTRKRCEFLEEENEKVKAQAKQEAAKMKALERDSAELETLKASLLALVSRYQKEV